MDIKEIKSSNVNKVYEISIPSSKMKEITNAKLQKIANNTNIQGFRPGKAPLTMVEKQYKSKAISEALEEATNLAIEQIYKDYNPRTISQPKVKLDSFDLEQDTKFTVELELFPEIKDVDFSKISIEKTIIDIEEKDIEESLQQIANYYKSFEDLTQDVPVKIGDVAVINFLGKLDGIPFEGGSGENFPLELGSNMFIPGFEEQLVGKKKGEKVVLKVNFPDNYHAKHLAGRESEFEVDILNIQKVVPSPFDDELAKKNGFNTIAELREDILSKYKSHVVNLELKENKDKILQELEKITDIEIPQGILTEEKNALWDEFVRNKDHMKSHLENNDFETHNHSKDEIELYKKSDEEVKVEHHNIALKRLRLGLLLNDIAIKNEITVKDEDVQSLLLEESKLYNKDVNSLLAMYKANQNALKSLQGRILENKVLSFVLSKVKFNEKRVPFSNYKK
jgi:trigger factor